MKKNKRSSPPHSPRYSFSHWIQDLYVLVPSEMHEYIVNYSGLFDQLVE